MLTFLGVRHAFLPHERLLKRAVKNLKSRNNVCVGGYLQLPLVWVVAGYLLCTAVCSLRSCPLPINPLCLSREEELFFSLLSQRSKEAKKEKKNAWSRVQLYLAFSARFDHFYIYFSFEHLAEVGVSALYNPTMHHVTWHHVTLLHLTSYLIISRHAMLIHVTSHHITMHHYIHVTSRNLKVPETWEIACNNSKKC